MIYSYTRMYYERPDHALHGPGRPRPAADPEPPLRRRRTLRMRYRTRPRFHPDQGVEAYEVSEEYGHRPGSQARQVGHLFAEGARDAGTRAGAGGPEADHRTDRGRPEGPGAPGQGHTQRLLRRRCIVQRSPTGGCQHQERLSIWK